jgi:hypothetical protein
MQAVCNPQVLQHAKQRAALKLGSPERGPTAAARRPPGHFDALLRRPGLSLRGSPVSLRSRVSPAATALLAEDLAAVAARPVRCAGLPGLLRSVQVGGGPKAGQPSEALSTAGCPSFSEHSAGPVWQKILVALMMHVCMYWTYNQ